MMSIRPAVRMSLRAFARLSFGLLLVGALGLTAVPPSGVAGQRPENVNSPGGKWMPHQLTEHAENLRRLGLEIDINELANMESGLLQAIVSLGFCSGSFISADGLIITNHHCVQRMLNYMSQVDREKGINSDFVGSGFLARTRQEERSAGPAQKIYITQKIEDVTAAILEGTDQIADPQQRYQAIEDRIKEMVRHREQGHPQVRVEVKSFYRGAKYFLIEQLELRDIRLVYAPPKGVGYYGGDTDNWHWPRHTGDFALIRAYVGTDGSSQPLHSNNVPYRNARHLSVSRAGLHPYDLVFVAGYPGRTNRLVTAEEVRAQVERSLPEGIEFIGQLKSMLDAMSGQDPVVYGKTEATRFGLANVIKKNASALEALKRIKYVELRTQQQAEFVQWLNADEGRKARYGNVIEDLAAVQHRYDSQSSDATLGRLAAYVDLMASAIDIVRMAEERAKPDAARDPGYQQRNWARLEAAEEARQKIYHRGVNIASMGFILKRASETLTAEQRPAYLNRFFENGVFQEARVQQLFERSQLESLDQRVQLLRTATPETLSQSSDPLLQFALEVVPLLKARDEQSKAYAGDMTPVMTRYIGAMEEFMASKGQGLAPDANSSLRLTYGQVKGYRTPTTGQWRAPFTNVGGLLDKHKINHDEFEVPYNVQQAAARGHFEHYADPYYGSLPLNFLAGVDTTGGNSGSAALNARGELVGLLFDGNEDTLYSDWHYDDREVRAILLDIRYFLWTLDEVEKAHDLMREMTITPACEHLLGGAGNR